MHPDGRPLVEDCLALDLAWLMRLATIREGQAGTGDVRWSVNGDVIGALRFQLDLRQQNRPQLILQFNVRNAENSAAPMHQAIALSALPQNFGGVRWWMICPSTGARVRKIYFPPQGVRFAGRKAHGLSYRVERLTRFDRPFEKLFRAQRYLSGAQGLGLPLARPKGMWRKTFARHIGKVEKHDLACADHFIALI